MYKEFINSINYIISCLLQADIEIPIPHYFTAENSKVFKEREKMMNMVLGQLQPIHDEVTRHCHLL